MDGQINSLLIDINDIKKEIEEIKIKNTNIEECIKKENII